MDEMILTFVNKETLTVRGSFVSTFLEGFKKGVNDMNGHVIIDNNGNYVLINMSHVLTVEFLKEETK